MFSSESIIQLFLLFFCDLLCHVPSVYTLISHGFLFQTPTVVSVGLPTELQTTATQFCLEQKFSWWSLTVTFGLWTSCSCCRCCWSKHSPGAVLNQPRVWSLSAGQQVIRSENSDNPKITCHSNLHGFFLLLLINKTFWWTLGFQTTVDKTTLRYLSKHHLLCLQLYLGKSNDVNRIEQTFYCTRTAGMVESCSLCIFVFVCRGDSIYSSETVVSTDTGEDKIQNMYWCCLLFFCSCICESHSVKLEFSTNHGRSCLSCTPSVFPNCVPDHIWPHSSIYSSENYSGSVTASVGRFHKSVLCVLLTVWFNLCVPVVGRGSRFLCPTPRSQTALAPLETGRCGKQQHVGDWQR